MGFFDRLFGPRKAQPAPAEPPAPPPAWAPFFQAGDQYERFESHIRSYFKSTGRRALIVEGILRVTAAPGNAHAAMDESQYGLGNLGQVCAQAEEHEWPSIISTHFERATCAERPGGDETDFEAVRDRLGIRLWPPGILPADAMVTREDIPGLLSVLCIDHAHSISTVSRDDAERWGRPLDELLEIGMSNQSRLAPVVHQTIDLPENHLLHELLGESPFSCSAALRMLEQFPQVDGPHGHFFSVPSRHRVIAMPFLDASSLNVLGNLMSLTMALERDGPGSISPKVFWRHRGRVLEIPYAIEGDRLEISPPQEFVDYLDQHLGGID